MTSCHCCSVSSQVGPCENRANVPVVSETLEELVQPLRVDASALVNTVSDFNAASSPGLFDPFKVDGLSASPEG